MSGPPVRSFDQRSMDTGSLSSTVLFMSGGTVGPEARAFVANVNEKVYEKPLDLPLLAAHLRRLAEIPY